jgi:hypothetical protein
MENVTRMMMTTIISLILFVIHLGMYPNYTIFATIVIAIIVVVVVVVHGIISPKGR